MSGTPYPLGESRLDADGTYWSPKGVPVFRSTLDKVNVALLAWAYAAETDFEIPEPLLDNPTRTAWQQGYRNPRVPSQPPTTQGDHTP